MPPYTPPVPCWSTPPHPTKHGNPQLGHNESKRIKRTSSSPQSKENRAHACRTRARWRRHTIMGYISCKQWKSARHHVHLHHRSSERRRKWTWQPSE